MVHEIFISYRRKDSSAYAPQIYDALKTRTDDPDAVFMDVDNIPFGFDFRDVLNDALAACEVVLAIIGPDWAGRLGHPNDFVRLELEAALNRDIPIIPVFVKDLESVPQDALPESLEGLAYRHGLRLRMGSDRSRDLSKIATAAAEARTYYRSQTQSTPDPEALYEAGKELIDAERYEEAVGPIQEAAGAGHAGAQNALGKMYFYGNGLQESDSKAIDFFKKAAEQDHANAQFNLGWMYANGRGVEQDDAEAVRWYRKATEQGNENARAALDRLTGPLS